jgi:ribonuclease Z
VVIPFEVNHGLECVGFRVDQNSSTVTFALDTRPCANVVRYAKGADLLDHEAYGPESSAKQTHAFAHSTAAEAGRTAGEADVGRLVLTHLRASRHAAAEELVTEAAQVFGGPVAAAQDLDAYDF